MCVHIQMQHVWITCITYIGFAPSIPHLIVLNSSKCSLPYTEHCSFQLSWLSVKYPDDWTGNLTTRNSKSATNHYYLSFVHKRTSFRVHRGKPWFLVNRQRDSTYEHFSSENSTSASREFAPQWGGTTAHTHVSSIMKPPSWNRRVAATVTATAVGAAAAYFTYNWCE